MSQCNPPQNVNQTILCAKVCYEKWINPIAKYSFDNWVLSDDSTYFDNNLNRQVAWLIYVDGELFHEIGYGDTNSLIPNFSNGSSYGNLILGVNNYEFLNYLESLPNTIIPKNTNIEIYIQVKDSNNMVNLNISNKYLLVK